MLKKLQELKKSLIGFFLPPVVITANYYDDEGESYAIYFDDLFWGHFDTLTDLENNLVGILEAIEEFYEFSPRVKAKFQYHY